MKLFHSARPAQLELVPAREVRVFQSETAEILEGPEPLKAHLTVVILAGMFASLLLVVACMRVDRVISSLSGEIVTVEPTVVLGALDQSIIKTIDVSEGQKVMKGDLLATLDPTFTRADVGALKSQVANLNAQIATWLGSRGSFLLNGPGTRLHPRGQLNHVQASRSDVGRAGGSGQPG